MPMQLTPADCILILAIGLLGGISYSAAPNILSRMRGIPLPLDRELAEVLAERATRSFFFHGPMADLPWNEFERYRAVQGCEKHIQQALIAYVDTMRKRYGDDPDEPAG